MFQKEFKADIEGMTIRTVPTTSNLEVTIAGITCVVPFANLYEFMFTISDKDKRVDLIPVHKREMRRFVRQHNVVAKKDLKAGETLVVNCNVDVPEVVVQGLTKMKEIQSPEYEAVNK